jgi:hypothetical protein
MDVCPETNELDDRGGVAGNGGMQERSPAILQHRAS